MTTAVNANNTIHYPVSFLEETEIAIKELLDIITEIFFTIINWVVSLFYSPPVVLPTHMINHLDANPSLKNNILGHIFQHLPPRTLSSVALVSKEWNTFAKDLQYAHKMKKLEANEDLYTTLQILKQIKPGQTHRYYHDQLCRYQKIVWQYSISISDYPEWIKNSLLRQRLSLLNFRDAGLYDELILEGTVNLFKAVADQVPEASELNGTRDRQNPRLIRKWYLEHLSAVAKIQKLCFVPDHTHDTYKSYEFRPWEIIPLEFLLLSGLKEICIGKQMIPEQIADLCRVEQIHFSQETWLPGSFTSFPNLTQLHINRALLTEYHFQWICARTTLQSLYLDSCSVDCLPKEISQLKHLKSLMVIQHRLYSLPIELSELPDLRHLAISHVADDSLPVLFKMTQLDSLALLDCSWESLPREMGDLSKLDVLSIGHNGKSLTFPKELKSWAKIREFRLRFNHDPEQKIYRFIFRRGGFGISDHTITLEELQAINKPNSSLRDPRLMNDLERELFNLKKKGEFILFEKQKALMEAQQLFFEREKLLIDLQNTNSLLEAKMEAKILQRAVLEAIKKNRVNNDPTPDKNT